MEKEKNIIKVNWYLKENRYIIIKEEAELIYVED